MKGITSSWRRQSLFLAMVAATATTFAQENSAVQLSNVVVSAAGYEQKLVDAPASVSIISAEDLRAKPYTNLLDALRYVEGIDLGTGQDKSGQGSISMRGLGSDYTLILIDGRRQNNNGDIYPNGFGGFQSAHIPPLDMIERIEVVRGPMSTLYGADALGGVVNIITKKVSDKWLGSITHTRTFQENSKLGDETTTDFSINGPLISGKLGLNIRGSVYDKDESISSYPVTQDPDGKPYSPSTGFGGGGKTADNRNYSSGFRLSITPDERNTILIDYDISRQKYDNRQSQFGTLDSADTIYRSARVGYSEFQRTERDQFYVSHIGVWDFGRSEVTLQHQKTVNDGRSLPLTIDQRAALRDKKAADAEADVLAWIESELLPRPNRDLSSEGLTLDAKLEIPLGSHYAVVGGQIINQEMHDNVFGILDGAYQRNKTQKHQQWSLFAEDNWGLTDNFTLTTGIRYDDHSLFGGHFSPRMYGVYNLTHAWTIKGGVSTGYKTPKTSDLYAGLTGFGGQGVSPWAGNPDLKPETSVSGELAVYFSADEGHTFNATVFNTRFKDKIQTSGNCKNNPEGSAACANIDPRWTQSLDQGGFNQNVAYSGNISDAEIRGTELAGKYVLPYGLALKANYTYTDSEVTKGPAKGRPLTGNPTSAASRSADTPAKHMANVNLDWQLNDQLNLYVGLYAESDRVRGWDADGVYLPDYKAYQVYHLGAIYDVSKTFTLSGRVNNLFNRDFTSYDVDWRDNGGTWVPTKRDDYKVIDKSRNFWLSANMKF